MFAALLLAAGASALTTSPPADFDGTNYNVAAVDGSIHSFDTTATYTFENAGDVSALPSGLIPSTDDIGDTLDPNSGATYNHTFKPENIAVNPPYLELTVPGGQAGNTNSISSAEIFTEDFMLYGSIRTVAVWSTEPGTVNGLFFYRDDTNEIDIEFVTDPNGNTNNDDDANAAKASAPDGSPGRTLPPVQYTNQPPSKDVPEAHTDVYEPGPQGAEHEYRVDWFEGSAEFYTDGQHTATLTDYVPSVSMHWLINNWANGSPGFSVGPPNGDSVLKIKSIVMYYNKTDS